MKGRFLLILAYDAAAAACSAALVRDGVPVAREWQAMARGHAEVLVPMIERVMRGTPFNTLTAMGVTVGPGAFTGLRIALATARGLVLATKVPAIGVSSFDVALHQTEAACPRDAAMTVIALETKRTDIYLQAFDVSGVALTAPASVPPDDIARWLPPVEGTLAVAGDAADRLIGCLPPAVNAVRVAGAELPDAVAVAALTAACLAPSPGVMEAKPLQPLYLRPPDAKLPAPGALRRK